MLELENVLPSYLFITEIATMETVFHLQLGEGSN